MMVHKQRKTTPNLVEMCSWNGFWKIWQWVYVEEIEKQLQLQT